MAGLVTYARPRARRYAGLVQTADELTASYATGGRMLPVLPELRPLLPGGGLRRGSTIAVVPPGASLLLALLAAASRAGSWCAVVGVPHLGAVAASELGIDLSRLVLVPAPGAEWVTVVSALVDGMDLVAAAPPGPVAASVAGRLAARIRQRGSILVPYGPWTGADVTLEVVRGVWQGLGQGHGRLHSRHLTVAARGRGAASRPRQARIWLPAPASVPADLPAGLPAGRPVLTVIPGLAETRAAVGAAG